MVVISMDSRRKLLYIASVLPLSCNKYINLTFAERKCRPFIMPVKNKNVDGSNVPGKNKKLDLEDDDDADGKQDDCSDLTDNNHETDESSSKSFPQKVSS